MKPARLSNTDYPSFPSFINRFFEGDLMDWNNFNFAGFNSTLPAVNVSESDNEFQIEVAAPGMKKGDFKVNYDNGRLTISAESKDEKKEGSKKYTRREYSYQSFQRSFTLPEEAVITDKIHARYNDGVLQITVPKQEEAKTKPARTINIS